LSKLDEQKLTNFLGCQEFDNDAIKFSVTGLSANFLAVFKILE